LKQNGHEYIGPRTNDDNQPAAGIEEWWFTTGQVGKTTASMSYGRPWEGGEKDARTFLLTVVVK
jgi:predicted secreted protein